MPKLLIILNDLSGGGVQRNAFRLIQALETQKSLDITLVVAEATGELLNEIPPNINFVDLGVPYYFRLKNIKNLVFPLSQSIKKYEPDSILSRLPGFNFVTVVAWKLAGSPGRLVLGEHTLPIHRFLQIENKNSSKSLVGKLSPFFCRWLYPQANQVIGASHGIAHELQNTLKLSKDKLQVIYNPVVDDRIEDQAALPIQHPWFKPGEPPVFLAVGRLSKQKDYPTLLQAFAKVCCTHKIRLLILGEGELRKQLQDLIKELKVEESVNMLGFVSNPYLYMAHATALVLSSVWEVLPTVLIEALACGCSVISTDCDYGPREILDEERYGKLVPVGDVNALAEAMLNALTQLPDRQRLKTYAQKFSIKAATDLYIEILGL